MSSSLANVLVAAEEQGRELPMHPYMFGALALVLFMALLGVLWAFRGTAQRYSTGHAPKHTQAGERH